MAERRWGRTVENLLFPRLPRDGTALALLSGRASGPKTNRRRKTET
jgi:hypothetical protein